MKNQSTGIFRRIGLLIFIIVTVLSGLFVALTYMATTEYYEASTQLLNKDVAAHIAKFSSPFGKNGVDKKKADSVFYNAMIVSPNVEVYFLDNNGRVVYYHAADSLIKTRVVPLENIKQYIKAPDVEITNIDPKDPGHAKIFSAAEVWNKGKQIGYIYVILVSKQYRNVADFVFRSRVGGLAIKVLIIIIIATVIFSILYTSRLQKRFNHVVSVLGTFREGDLNIRFPINKHDDFYPISQAFNQMADMLESNFKQLRSLEDERKNFLANIAHDLRTPLAVARGYAETLLIEKNTDIAQRDVQVELVLNKILQVEKLVLQLFELSRMESVNFHPVKEPFIFSEVLLEILHGARFQAQQKKIELNCEDCEDRSLISADISMLERVVQNLIENALKYTPGGGQIKVSLSHTTGYLVFKVINTGELISPEICAWINSAAENDFINRPKNTGLGLALVKRIIQLHDFSLSAKADKMHFNELVITMPLYGDKA